MSLTSCDPYLDDILGEWSRPTPGGNVTPDTGGDSTPAAAPTYLKWNDGTQVLEAVEIPDAPSMTSTTTTWSGTYIVSEDVTIDDDVTLGGDVDLIILDGKTLTLTDDHWITASSNTYTLNIYGQSTTTGAGKLVVNTTNQDRSINVESGTVNIHSGIVSATATKDHSIAVWSKNMNVYGGEVEAKGFAIALKVDNLNILGGTVTAENGDGAGEHVIRSSKIIIDGATTSVTVKGGKAKDYGSEQVAASVGILANTSMTINDGEVIVTGGDGVTNMGRGAVAIFVHPAASLTVNGGSLTATGGKAADNRNGGNAFEGSLVIKGGKAKFVGGDGSGTGAGGYGIKYTTSPGIDYYGGSVMALGGSGNTDGEANSDGSSNGDIKNSSGSVQTYRGKSNSTSPWANGGSSISAGDTQSITGTMGIAIPAEW
ncbi:MAG: hypothetical protein J5965_26860 [Aeriscardovia sp.]|nr:hypothetical protein [Aeriscardovia sp.]